MWAVIQTLYTCIEFVIISCHTSSLSVSLLLMWLRQISNMKSYALYQLPVAVIVCGKYYSTYTIHLCDLECRSVQSQDRKWTKLVRCIKALHL